MKDWGLDYESARKLRPDIIYYSTSQQGRTGPLDAFLGHGSPFLGFLTTYRERSL